MENYAVNCILLVYNHEKYVAQAIESMVCQETNFPYNIIIHDDCSTDGSQDIIRHYEALYPDKILAIFEEENLHSKKDDSLCRTLAEFLSADYVACLEGDDFWCDPHKLQKQYDMMLAHPDASLIVHNTLTISAEDDSPIGCFNSHTEPYILPPEDVLGCKWQIHTSSYFCTRDVYEAHLAFYMYFFGDFVLATIALAAGNIYYLPDFMSTYRWAVKTGVTYQNLTSGKSAALIEKPRADYLATYDKLTNFRFHDLIMDRIIRILKGLSLEVESQ